MSLGSWDPKVEAQSTELLLESDLLRRLIAYSDEEKLTQLEQLLNASDKPPPSPCWKMTCCI
jgi:hypothetical protein